MRRVLILPNIKAYNKNTVIESNMEAAQEQTSRPMRENGQLRVRPIYKRKCVCTTQIHGEKLAYEVGKLVPYMQKNKTGSLPHTTCKVDIRWIKGRRSRFSVRERL